MESSGDISYNVALLGTCTLAELSIGIVCCCLPVFPRFFQMIGPKVASFAKRSFTFSITGSKSNNSKSSRKSTIVVVKSEITGDTSQDLDGQAQRKYEILDDNELQQSRKNEAGIERGGGDTDGIKLTELETGIRVTQEFEVEISNAACGNVDLESQREVASRQEVWR